FIRHTASGARRGRRVVVRDIETFPRVQVRADRVVAHGRERAHNLTRPAVVAGQVVDDDDSTTRRRIHRASEVALDQIAARTGKPNRLGEHGVILCSTHSGNLRYAIGRAGSAATERGSGATSFSTSRAPSAATIAPLSV